MSKPWILLMVVAVLATGIVICPHQPRVDADRLLCDVLWAGRNVSYVAVQEQTSVIYGKKIYSTITARHNGCRLSDDIGLSSLIFRNYTPLVEGRDRIAGRNTWILRLKPKLKKMPWKQIWVDKRRFVILASRDWTAYNTFKCSMKTISITFGSRKLQPACFSSETTRLKSRFLTLFEMTGCVDKEVLEDIRVPQPSYLPHGFILTSADPSNLVYSDGLYSITIHFDQAGSPNRAMNKALDWGQGLIYVTRCDNKKITIVADLSSEEIERIARSMTP